MPTLYVENVPADLYAALKKRAKSNRKSMAAEVIDLLKDSVPTEEAMERRHALYKTIQKFQKKKSLTPGLHPSAEETIRELRDR
jgi:plasmid stability protein